MQGAHASQLPIPHEWLHMQPGQHKHMSNVCQQALHEVRYCIESQMSSPMPEAQGPPGPAVDGAVPALQTG